MERTIRALTMDDLPRLSSAAKLAYPPYGDAKWRREAYFIAALEKRQSGVFYGCFDGDLMAGFMELYDFKMNLRGTILPAGGIGFIGVDPLYKRQGVASDMIDYYENHYKQRNIFALVLYPINIAYYLKKGYCCHTRMYQYRISPLCFPFLSSPDHVRIAGEEVDHSKILDCFEVFFTRANGMLMKREADLRSLLSDNHVVIYEKNGVVEGYAIFNFEKENENYVHMDNMMVTEWIWTNRESFLELCAFFHNQADQVKRVIVNSPYENLHLCMSDPSSGLNYSFKNLRHEFSAAATDSMMKISSGEGIFRQLEGCGFSEDIRVRFEITRSGGDNESFLVNVSSGHARVVTDGKCDVSVTMPQGVFTALISGAANFGELYTMGMAAINDSALVSVVDAAFQCRHRPQTLTYF